MLDCYRRCRGYDTADNNQFDELTQLRPRFYVMTSIRHDLSIGSRSTPLRHTAIPANTDPESFSTGAAFCLHGHDIAPVGTSAGDRHAPVTTAIELPMATDKFTGQIVDEDRHQVDEDCREWVLK